MNLSPVPDFASPGRPARVALAVTLLVGLLQAARNSSGLSLSLGDTDDALRLVQVRDLLARQVWFDTHIDRLQPPAGLDMHWSRLLDGAMALVDGGLGLLLPAETAELIFRFLWPLLWVFPLMLGAALIARRLGGSPAVLAAAIFIASVPVQVQFGPGRIDHHNAQIALSMLALAGAINLENRWGPWLAGIATGALLAIGLEAIIFAALCGVKIALRFADDPQYAKPARRYAIGLGVTALLAFFAQTPPHLWTATACDMLSINLLGGLLAAACALFLASFVGGSRVKRLIAVLAAGAFALSVYLALDPSCARGPYAHMNPRLYGLWLDHVVEVSTWLTFYRTQPEFASALIAPVLLAMIGFMVAAWRDRSLLRSPAFILVLAVFLAALISGLFVIRSLSYASAFGAVLLAGAFPRLLPDRAGQSFIAAALCAFLISPTPVSIAAALIGSSDQAETQTGKDRKLCVATASFAELAALPPGLVLADIDAGTHLLAHTPHSAIAAPYHRMGVGIPMAHDLWAAPVAEAASQLKRDGVSYVLLCPARGRMPYAVPAGTLRGALSEGQTPPGLQPVPAGPVFRVWRVN